MAGGTLAIFWNVFGLVHHPEERFCTVLSFQLRPNRPSNSCVVVIQPFTLKKKHSIFCDFEIWLSYMS